MSKTKTKTRNDTDLTFPKRYKVVFHNDDITPMHFVVALLVEVFDQDLQQAQDITTQIHEQGQGIAGVYSHEVAEQKQAECLVYIHAQGYPLKITIDEVGND